LLLVVGIETLNGDVFIGNKTWIGGLILFAGTCVRDRDAAI
jgi:hypothetical protein